ncbi:HlyD family secretion protein [Kordiimonas aestuarii]|uniref:HlyD family secretion protein n=1 Tax=Kordiimonas aestuarii TaxID=1005925 RepID=UPI0021CE52F4|nr:HlyD family secretion protein [Kordiimonas aestuarii]
MKRILLYVCVPSLIILGVCFVYLNGGREITTDNAYVRAGILTGASRVPGEVIEVLVKRNQHVDEGTLIARLDDSDARIKLTEAKVGVISARHIVAALRANYRKSLALLDKEKETLAFETRELNRAEQLAKDQNLSESALDGHRHDVEEARREIVVLEEAAQMALTQLGGDADILPDRHPMVLKALAAVEAAKVTLEHLEIRTRTAGTITQIDLHPGEYITAGYPIYGMTVDGDLRVEANPKETELAHVRVGQSVDVTIDALPGLHFKGKVASIDPATGAEFAVLPAQNATGNWVKVTQRVPVQIKLDSDQDTKALRSGLSVEVSIDTGHERSIKDLATLIGL